jgi:hypothetical protein
MKYYNLTNKEKEVAEQFLESYAPTHCSNVRLSRNECMCHDPSLVDVEIFYIRLGGYLFISDNKEHLFFSIFGDNQIPQETQDAFASNYEILEFSFWDDYAKEEEA